MLQPAKEATPATAAFGLDVQARMAPAGVVMARVTLELLPVAVLPPESCTVTTGWVAKTVELAEPTGCVVKANLAAMPELTVRVELIAWFREPSVAVRV